MIADTAAAIERFTKTEVLNLLEQIQPIFLREPRLLKLPNTPLIFIGDTHGDWDATKRVLARFWSTPATFVFLGDYVDRGPFQIENINLLFQLKLEFPQRMMILRGNHETPWVNRAYGFYDAVHTKFGDILEEYWRAFANLPLAALSRNQHIFAVHGGIPEKLSDINQINTLPREVTIENQIAYQLLWNDPRETLKGFGSSMRGDRIRTFGEDVTKEFMNTNNLDLIVRAHEVFPHGFHEFFNGRIISLFSCRNYRGPIAGKAFHVMDSGTRELIPI
jgi:protein phosphatase